MGRFKRLSERDGQRKTEGPFEGVPAHLAPHLVDWLRRSLQAGAYTITSIPAIMALEMHVPVDAEYDDRAADDLVNAAKQDPDLLLDLVDYRLNLGIERSNADSPEGILALAGSVWRVNDLEDGLVRRVDASAEAAMDRAAATADAASEELRSAWTAAYGRDPDPSDAWDHAIKAVEHLIIPIVIPKSSKGTLGQAIGTIRAAPHAWETELGGIEDLLTILNLIWANPDRHGNADQREPVQSEAEAVVQIAVTLIQWLRTGFLRKR